MGHVAALATEDISFTSLGGPVPPRERGKMEDFSSIRKQKRPFGPYTLKHMPALLSVKRQPCEK